MNYITVDDLIEILNELPENAKSMKIFDIRGCACGDTENIVRGFQFHLRDSNGKDSYVLVPHKKEDVLYDTFGERCIKL